MFIMRYIAMITFIVILADLFESQATQVNLTANEAAVVTSSVTKDVDGERTARLLFPPNTTVTVINENGRTMVR